MGKLDELIKALQARNEEFALAEHDYQQSATKQRNYDTRRFTGIIPSMIETVVDNVRKKQTAPAHRETLQRALDAAGGVDAKQREIDQLQAMMQQMEEYSTRAETEGLYRQTGMSQPESALMSRGMEIPAGQKPTSRMQDFNFRGTLTPEQQVQFDQSRGGQNINVYTGDKDYVPDTRPGALPNAVMVRPGSAADVKQQVTATKKVKRQAGIQRAGGTVVQDLGRALALMPLMIQNSNDGPGSDVLGANARVVSSKIRGSIEYQINDFIESAKSNIGLDRLQQMRESSPTGGALGQVPFQQQKRLEQVLGNIHVGQPPPVMEANAQRIQNIYFDIMYGSADERAWAVELGDITQEESDQVETLYFDLPFDAQGRPKDKSAATPDGEAKEGDVVHNKKTGETLVLRNGKWRVQQ